MRNYISVWRQFNNFIIKLDELPESWEDRVTLFGAVLVDSGIQSSTLRSYFSAIKCMLVDDGYKWDQNKVLVNTLTRTCKCVNDVVRTRLPIQKSLLEMLCFKIECTYAAQPYLERMFKAFFLLLYYGLFRIGELAWSQHAVRAKDVHIANNKDKMLFVLYTSKTHGLESKPQKIKISSVQSMNKLNSGNIKRFFCPFASSREYLAVRGNSLTEQDPFFILSDNSPVTPALV